jgi:hypothetical protein
MDASDKFNDLIDEAIDALVDDDINRGADELIELAHIFAKAGAGQSSFNSIRKYIITEARERTCAPFIAEKLKIIERRKQSGRKISNLKYH